MTEQRFDDLAKVVAGRADGADIYDPPNPRTTYEACSQAGGEVWSQYGLCNNIEGWRRSYQCGAIQYCWRNCCSVGYQTIDEGCGSYLF